MLSLRACMGDVEPIYFVPVSKNGAHIYHEFSDRGHFQERTFKALVRAIMKQLGNAELFPDTC